MNQERKTNLSASERISSAQRLLDALSCDANWSAVQLPLLEEEEEEAEEDEGVMREEPIGESRVVRTKVGGADPCRLIDKLSLDFATTERGRGTD